MTEGQHDPGKAPPTAIAKVFSKLQLALNRLTGGLAFNTLGGKEVCFVTMTGAKSGRTLTIPLMFMPYRGGVLLVASQGGAPKNPVWYNNLVAHPDIEVRHRRERTRLRARLATSEEKPALWRLCDEYYPPFVDYRARTEREIPIFVCEPRP